MGIIGWGGKHGRGRYGQWLRKVLSQLDYDVIGSDIGTELTNKEVVQRADIVIFSVPTRRTPSIIRKVLPYVREAQLLMDVTSVKTHAVVAMLESRAEVVGLHPECAPPPSYSWRGQNVVVCEARLTDRWRPWVSEFLQSTEATVKFSDPDTHDRYMGPVQVLPHDINVALAATFRRSGLNMAEMLSFATPPFRLGCCGMGRTLKQDPHLLIDIQVCNPHTPAMLRRFELEFGRVRRIVERMIKTGDRRRYLREFRKSQEFFGENLLAHTFESFDNLIGLMVDLMGSSVVLVQVKEDRPGVLHEILTPFSDAGINLIALHSRKVGAKGFRFLINLDRDRTSPEVVATLKKIEAIPSVEIVKN